MAAPPSFPAASPTLAAPRSLGASRACRRGATAGYNFGADAESRSLRASCHSPVRRAPGQGLRLGALPLVLPLALLGLSGVAACGGDPILERAAELEADGGAGEGGATGDGAAQADGPGGGEDRRVGGGAAPILTGEPEPGVVTPAEPAPGVPKEPQPGDPGQPPPGEAGAAGPPPSEGPTVTLSGTVRVPSYTKGIVRIDLFDGDQRKLEGPRPSVVAVTRVDAPGAWSAEVPAGQAVWIGAYVDVNGDGRPAPGEPSGWYADNPVQAGADQAGLELLLEVSPEEGAP